VLVNVLCVKIFCKLIKRILYVTIQACKSMIKAILN